MILAKKFDKKSYLRICFQKCVVSCPKAINTIGSYISYLSNGVLYNCIAFNQDNLFEKLKKTRFLQNLKFVNNKQANEQFDMKKETFRAIQSL